MRLVQLVLIAVLALAWSLTPKAPARAPKGSAIIDTAAVNCLAPDRYSKCRRVR